MFGQALRGCAGARRSPVVDRSINMVMTTSMYGIDAFKFPVGVRIDCQEDSTEDALHEGPNRQTKVTGIADLHSIALL